jgi:hypothetical protein
MLNRPKLNENIQINSPGSLLNDSSDATFLTDHPTLKALIPADLASKKVSLEQCDLWNLTFASGADEHLFKRSRGELKCR